MSDLVYLITVRSRFDDFSWFTMSTSGAWFRRKLNKVQGMKLIILPLRFLYGILKDCPSWCGHCREEGRKLRFNLITGSSFTNLRRELSTSIVLLWKPNWLIFIKIDCDLYKNNNSSWKQEPNRKMTCAHVATPPAVWLRVVCRWGRRRWRQAGEAGQAQWLREPVTRS